MPATAAAPRARHDEARKLNISATFQFQLLLSDLASVARVRSAGSPSQQLLSSAHTKERAFIPFFQAHGPHATTTNEQRTNDNQSATATATALVIKVTPSSFCFLASCSVDSMGTRTAR